MENKKPVSSVVGGLILAGLLIVVSVILNSMGGGGSQPSGGWITWLVIIGGLMFFISRYAKSKDNFVTFGELFSYGFKTTAMMTLVFLAFIVILAFATPELKDEAIKQARIEYEKKGGMPQNDIDTILNTMDKYFWLGFAGLTMLVFFIIGAIGSLLGAAVTQKRPKNTMSQMDQLDQLTP